MSDDPRFKEAYPFQTDVLALPVTDLDGQKYRVFFVVAPDGLCYYFHEPMN